MFTCEKAPGIPTYLGLWNHGQQQNRNEKCSPFGVDWISMVGLWLDLNMTELDASCTPDFIKWLTLDTAADATSRAV